jgi:L,D-transpeptidase YcbB
VELPLQRSALAAALPLLLVPAAASAQSMNAPPAIATGLAIPVGAAPQQASASLFASAHVPAHGQFVLVDAASARLFMIENRQVVDSMKVIVAKPSTATPQIHSTIYYATLNPYWNVPVDLARTIIAPHVLQSGMSYLKDRGYEVVSGFKRDAKVLPPEDVD